MNGLPSGSLNIMVLLHGQRMAPGAITPQSICSISSLLQAVVEILTNEAAKALNILAK
jgi:hypothetical protein